jgi:hypothetical protein
VIDTVEQALYAAKAAGRNQACPSACDARSSKKPCPSFDGKAFIGAICYKNNSYLRMFYKG